MVNWHTADGTWQILGGTTMEFYWYVAVCLLLSVAHILLSRMDDLFKWLFILGSIWLYVCNLGKQTTLSSLALNRPFCSSNKSSSKLLNRNQIQKYLDIEINSVKNSKHFSCLMLMFIKNFRLKYYILTRTDFANWVIWVRVSLLV